MNVVNVKKGMGVTDYSIIVQGKLFLMGLKMNYLIHKFGSGKVTYRINGGFNMTYREAVKEFKRQNAKLYNDRVDYWTGQLAWSEYVDSLCKSGEITEKQYSNWDNPFPYGKRLKPNKATLETII